MQVYTLDGLYVGTPAQTAPGVGAEISGQQLTLLFHLFSRLHGSSTSALESGETRVTKAGALRVETSKHIWTCTEADMNGDTEAGVGLPRFLVVGLR